MELLKRAPADLDWQFDFFPLQKWPECLPALCVNGPLRPVVVAGFDRRTSPLLEVLIVPGTASQVLAQIWPPEKLMPLEALRLNKTSGCALHDEHLLMWPLSFQNFLDQKQVPLKSLKPLAHLTEWQTEIAAEMPRLALSNAQVREILDLLCDLKFMGKVWTDCRPPDSDGNHWLAHLKQIRFTKTLAGDMNARANVKALPWPRGVQARWERQGDQAGLVIQARVTSPLDWKRFKENMVKLEIGDSFWI